jgi:hypothetical protein
MTSTLSLTIHGMWLTLESNNKDFLAYARGHLAALLSPPVGQPDIRVWLCWGQELFPVRASNNDYHRLGRRLLLADNEIVQTEILTLPGLQLRTSLNGTNVYVDAAFRPSSRWMRLMLGLGGKASQERIYATLIYYLVYFPLLWHIERTRQWYPLHASAVAWPQGAIILAGLGGVGKSTLTLSFLSDSHARLLSENLILHNKERVYAFLEPIHLDDRSREMLTSLNGRLKPTGCTYSHNRQSYEVPPSARVQSATPCAFFTLRQGRVLGLRSMSAKETLDIVLSSDALAREINEYTQQTAVLNLLSPIAGSLQGRIDALRKLLGQVACYELTIRPGEKLDQAVNLVRERLGW